ncbi:P-loop containing nucleoside triphosphate hydrolase protein [Aspergillus ellipticus CBS 707.79]|uniref:P-loop containing nucleoside triphosphate hydrolase protein n=1 Tax=Aspergillus ellipticus CBS 707.79 TaxID=1448320 RepID=A0A319EDX4_9EURO|nr:P-loop containing nucleoside triphosphate hydrolase protein [Aspergillus ellipticus CBS 707.79]
MGHSHQCRDPQSLWAAVVQSQTNPIDVSELGEGVRTSNPPSRVGCDAVHQRLTTPSGQSSHAPQPLTSTLLFEQSILSIVPSAIFLLLVPLRVWSLHGESIKTVANNVQWRKLSVAICLVALQIASVILWAQYDTVWTALPAGVLSLVDALSVVVLSAIEHDRSVRPSSLLSVYLLASVFFDAVQVRTLFVRHYPYKLAALFTAIMALKIILLALEAQSKRSYLKSPHKDKPPESISGIFARTVSWWLNQLFVNGFRALLTIEDLYATDEGLKSGPLRRKIRASWRKYKSDRTRTLMIAAVISLRWPVIRTVSPRICLIGFTYAQTFFIQRAITHLHKPDTLLTRNEGYGLIGAAALIYGGIAISTVHYKHQLFRMITMFRGTFVALIYDHTLVLRHGASDESAAVTLMSTDIDIIARSLEQASESWARLVEVAIGIWLLERQIGAICVAPILMYMATFMPGRQEVWVGAVQRRVGMISTVLGSMKSVKMSGLSELLATTLQGQRERELNLSRDFRWLIVWLNVLASFPRMCASLITFAAFVIRSKITQSEPLSTVQAFTSLAIISLITNPALQLLASIPAVTAAFGAFDRIYKFLISSSIDAPPSHENTSLVSAPSPAHERRTEMPNIRPSPESQFCLQKINLTLSMDAVTMIIGPIGCGKSTLLKALLGEIHCEAGTVNSGQLGVGYCSQNPWLQNTTIQANMCGYSVPDMGWYEEVVRACALEEDIARMPRGDQSVVGSRALTLSGGQRQRLALARAIYSRQKLIVLDDGFSGVDDKTTRFICEALFGKHGICRRFGPSVIMTTHSVQHLHFADKVAIMTSDGHIENQGPLHSLGLEQEAIMEMADVKLNESSTDPSSEKVSSAKKVQTLTVDDIADISRRTGDFAVYSYYLRAIGWYHTLIACVIIIVHTFAANFPQLWLELFTDDNGSQAGQFIGIYVLLAVVSSGSQGLMIWQIMIKIVLKSGLELHRILIQTVINAPMQFFAEVDSGIILNRFSQDMMVTLLDAVLPTMAFGTVLSAAQCLAQLALISLGSSYMAITIIPFLLVLYFAQKLYLRTSRQLRFLDLEAKSPLYTHFVETLEGLSTIRGLGWQRPFLEECLHRLDISQKPYYLLTCIQRWLNVVLDLLVAAMATPGKLGVSLTAIMAFNQTLQELVTSWTSLETSLGAVARTRSFEMKTPSEHRVEETFVPPPEWPAQGSIEIVSLSVSYDCVRIERPDRKAHADPLPSGKSTLLSVILRLVDPQAGTIIIDGIDIATIPRNILRSRIIAIPQEPYIFPGSVRFNLDPTGILPNEVLTSVLEKTNLLTLIDSRGGLDADLASQPLSQGEQRLLPLATALLRKWKRDDDGLGGSEGILILDEATSGTDAGTESFIQGVIEDEFVGYTIIHVSHRADSVAMSLDTGK